MGNILRVLKRDLLRIVKSSSALIVLVALLVLPSAYTWYNVVAFWDPYGNTGNVNVCIVNEDKGGSSDLTGSLNVGNSVVDALKENTQLHWIFTDRDTAMDELTSGRSTAVFVIPESFTQDTLSITTGNFTQPTMQYYVNEKTGPVSPKVTDTGATALEETINSTFISTVSDAVVKAMDESLSGADDSLKQTRSQALVKIDDALAQVKDARSSLSDASNKIANLQVKRSAAEAALTEASVALSKTSDQLERVSVSANKVQASLVELAPKMAEANGEAVEKLVAVEAIASSLGYGEEVRTAIEGLQTSTEIMYNQVIPSMARSAGSVSATSAALSATMVSQQSLISQSRLVLNQLDALLSSTRSSLTRTDTLLASVEGDLTTVRNDVATLSASTMLDELSSSVGGLDQKAIAEFMGNPTTVRTEQIYVLSSYGAAMAPLFMNLTFWIGAFMFLVVFRQEVDDENIENLTVTQRHVSRFLLFVIPAMIQAVVCCAGLLFLGMKVVNAPAMFFASAVASLAYISIIYALSVVLQHVGKGLCIFLVFVQIPAATGLYPLEMTADFYRVLSPLFPFTYGIAALRESICGFYGTQYATAVAMLFLFAAVFLVAGIVFRPITSNLNRMVAREIGETGLMNGEFVEVPERKYKLSQVMMAMTDRSGYREELQRRYSRFLSRYPVMVKIGIVLGVVVPVVTGLICSLAGVERVVTLTLWLAWFLVFITVMIALETFRHGFRSQFALNDMTEEELVETYGQHDSMHETAHHDPSHEFEGFRFWRGAADYKRKNGQGKSGGDQPVVDKPRDGGGPHA